MSLVALRDIMQSEAVNSKLPNTSDLDNGELALNYANGYETYETRNYTF